MTTPEIAQMALKQTLRGWSISKASLVVKCSCGHSASISMRALAQTKPKTKLGDVLDLVKCRRCGRKGAASAEITDGTVDARR